MDFLTDPKFLAALVLLGVGTFLLLKFSGTKKSGLPVTEKLSDEKVHSEEDKPLPAPVDMGNREEHLEKLCKKMPASFPNKVQFYFGSHTGTAEKFSKELADEATILGIEAEVVDFNDFEEKKFLSHEMLIISVATHYEGDPCDNTKAFYRWFK